MHEGLRVVDADLHVIEPMSIWEEYLDPGFRDRAPRPVPEKSHGWLVVGDRLVPAGAELPARQRALEIRYRSPEILSKLAARGDDEMSELTHGTTPGGMLKAMDVEGVDIAVVFRTKAAHVIAFDGMDPQLAAAYCRAFNRWVADFCSEDPSRLRAGMQVPLHDPAVAVDVAREAVEDLGGLTLVLPSHMVNGRPFDHPDYEPLWDLAEDLGVPVSFHGIQASHTDGMLANRYPGNPVLGHAVGHPVELMCALGSVVTGGVAARHPGLRFAFLEGNCGWLPWWLWALDERWEKWGDVERTGQTELPSEVFARQCWVATDVDEEELGHVAATVGGDNLVLSTDWPHDDSAYPEAITTFVGLPVDDDVKRKVLWDNPAALYGLDEGNHR